MCSTYQLKELRVPSALICWKDCLLSFSVDSSLDFRDWHKELKLLFDITSERLNEGDLKHVRLLNDVLTLGNSVLSGIQSEQIKNSMKCEYIRLQFCFFPSGCGPVCLIGCMIWGCVCTREAVPVHLVEELFSEFGDVSTLWSALQSLCVLRSP